MVRSLDKGSERRVPSLGQRNNDIKESYLNMMVMLERKAARGKGPVRGYLLIYHNNYEA